MAGRDLCYSGGMLSSSYEYILTGADVTGARKLAVLLHGYGRNATFMQKMADELADQRPDIAVLCPQAPEILNIEGMNNGAKESFLHVPAELREVALRSLDMSSARQWFAIDGPLESLFPRVEHAATRLNGFIDGFCTRMGIAAGDVALMGFSQGAGLALYTAMARTNPFAALVLHSTILLERPGADKVMASISPTLFIYGDQDPEFPQGAYAESFRRLSARMGPSAECMTVPGLGHVTNAESRACCAGFISRFM